MVAIRGAAAADQVAGRLVAEASDMVVCIECLDKHLRAIESHAGAITDVIGLLGIVPLMRCSGATAAFKTRFSALGFLNGMDGSATGQADLPHQRRAS